MPNNIYPKDTVDFAENILGLQLLPHQKIILKMAKQYQKPICIWSVRNCGRNWLRSVAEATLEYLLNESEGANEKANSQGN